MASFTLTGRCLAAASSAASLADSWSAFFSLSLSAPPASMTCAKAPSEAHDLGLEAPQAIAHVHCMAFAAACVSH
eukprot:CAMPEP_0119102668 /NCGR_PEP_ID=MMETSP1180-20130426/1334_1 /TAXON_ID=3052 ORGANISM="Chlamydomonas cf sp, Strain CCMP681" /NCGR_SAMPLE_ID=MMETSP1180 /ASSEMBLY_ACC=CAM_ASM_000741 /LENGTH=74 /DNA_ID=CAMNT_0007086993 /DNA_START=711 /DNA_END=936 /DNA_ORIENTATION=-